MTGFGTFDQYLQHARVSELALSPDGSRLVATVAELSADGDAFVRALWEIDPAGDAAPRRLTRSSGARGGESGPAFGPDGALYFVSARDGEPDDSPALWRLPAAGRPNSW